MPLLHQLRADAPIWKLLDERAEPGADREAIDRTIWETYGTEGAVLYSDLAGFSRWSHELGVTHFLGIIRKSHEILLPLVERHEGTLIEIEADSTIALFPTAAHAVQCALALLDACARYNAGLAPRDQLLLCLGLGYGSILQLDQDWVAGLEVNLACKLGEEQAEAYEILVSRNAMEAAGELDGVRFELTGLSLPGSEEVYRVASSNP